MENNYKSPMIEKRTKSPYPVYAIGIIFLLAGIVFPPYSLVNLIICLAVSAVAWKVLEKTVFPDKIEYEKAPPKPADTGDKQTDLLIMQGRQKLRQMEDLGAALTGTKLSPAISELLTSGNKILDFLTENTRHTSRVKPFLDYYLPTTVKLLENYATFKIQGVKGENIVGSMEKIEGVMDTIAKAFTKQLDNLYSDKALDINAEVRLMKKLIESEGLSDNVIDFPRKAGGGNG